MKTSPLFLGHVLRVTSGVRRTKGLSKVLFLTDKRRMMNVM